MTKMAYSIQEFCDAYSIGRTTAYAAIKDGKLHCVKIGKKSVIPVESANEWFNSLSKMQCNGKPFGR